MRNGSSPGTRPRHDSRIQKPRTRPTRPALPPARIRTYPRHLAVLCEEVSSARPSGCRIEPGRLAEPRQELLLRDFNLPRTTDQQVAILIDGTTNSRVEGHPFWITSCNGAEATFLPRVGHAHEISGKALQKLGRYGVG